MPNKSVQYRYISIGFDQSYANTGIALVGVTNNRDIEILEICNVSSCESKFEYRHKISLKIKALMRKYRHLAENVYAICESVRIFKDGNMSINNHLEWGALQGCIADCLYQQYDIYLRIVDTRAWKSKVVGTSTPAEKAPNGVDLKKWPTIKYVMKTHGIPKEDIATKMGKRTKKYTWTDDGEDGPETKYTFDSDKCDALCIALYGAKYPVSELKFAP